MAASDQTYRNQYLLDIVFAGSSVLMLVSIVLMFMQDYYRPWKEEQRAFRDVETAVAQTSAFEAIPMGVDFDRAEQEIARIEKDRKDRGIDTKLAELNQKMAALRPVKEENDSQYQKVKERYDSKLSFVNLAKTKEERDPLFKELGEIAGQLKKVQAIRDDSDQKMKDYQGAVAALEKELTDARGALKKLNDRFLTQTAQSINKRWGWGDFLRGLPIVDGFASPTKIQQYTINDIPIDYNLAVVRRFDRCTTCHQGIDRPTYTKDMLKSVRHPLPESVRGQGEEFWAAVLSMKRKKLGDADLKEKKLDVPDDLPYTSKTAWSKLVLDSLVRGDSKLINELPDYFEEKSVKNVRELWAQLLGEANYAITEARPDLRSSARRKALVVSYFERQWRLLEAQGRLERLIKTAAGTPEARTIPRPEDLQLSYVSERALTDSRIKEFCAHPRQDLFVSSNSKHPAEKFGCTSCHRGQGAGTTFNGSFHAPNNSEEEHQWVKQHAYGSDKHTFLWDYPMLPMRFVESSCLKCHHQVTDLYSPNNRNEAPKLLRGYNLIRENGCFGCHEIQGRKEGRQVGPDLRLEPVPPLEDLEQIERQKIESDVDNLPGQYRKVGPSLYRLAEKTNHDWTLKWLNGPRTFRPDTKMPHFYNLANNSDDGLPAEQKKFPAAEMQAVAYFLFVSSDGYLKDLKGLHDVKNKDEFVKKLHEEEQALADLISKPSFNPADREPYERLKKLLGGEVWVARHGMWMPEADKKRLESLLKVELDSGPVTPAMIKAGITKLRARVQMRKSPLLTDLVLDPKHTIDTEKGRQVFSEKSCLACHSHDGTHKASAATPAMFSEAQFGPNLSQVAAKLIKDYDYDKLARQREQMSKLKEQMDKLKEQIAELTEQMDKEKDKDKNKDLAARSKDLAAKSADLAVKFKDVAARYKEETNSARIWLRQWIRDPHVHSPRSRMPVARLTNEEIADVAEWLLEQNAQEATGSGWASVRVEDPDFKEYQALASVYLKRLMPDDYREKYLKGEVLEGPFIRDLPWDEQVLSGKANQPDALKYYLGKKAVGRLGCAACHDIPGFDAAKPIGTGLMDWGKKKSDKLAFEDVAKYIKEHYTIVPSLRNHEGDPLPAPEDSDGKMLYEKFFADLVGEHQREGFLHQKLVEPRSYDYNRILAWDDRSRMPQFRFARSHKRAGESDKEFEARMTVDEAEAREAVMTFVLGLVAEPVPLKSVNQPAGDRLAEVRGRQIIDKYNCAGCHLIRAGVFDFKLNREGNQLLDENFHATELKETDPVTKKDKFVKRPENYDFPTHYNWAGPNPEAPDKLTAEGVYNFTKYLSEDKTVAKVQQVRLAHALRYPAADAPGTLRDIPAFTPIDVPLANMIYPPPSAFDSKESLHAFLKDRGPLGGDFAYLLMNYLAAKDKIMVAKDKNRQPLYKMNNEGISETGLGAGPPILIGQGERTQTAWLTKFLRDPQPIRAMSVLRMPKFNMTEREAEDLVHYFAAVSRQQNVGTQIHYPDEIIPQQADFDSDYWRRKNQEHVKRLKADDGKLFEERVKLFTPLWEGKLQPYLESSRARLKTARAILSAAEEEAKQNLEEARKEAKEKKKELTREEIDEVMSEFNKLKPFLDRSVRDAKANVAGWEREIALLEKPFPKRASVEEQKQEWIEKYAYLTDALRLKTKICMECHQFGESATTKPAAGPPLTDVSGRLRPEWAKYWIAMPQRFVTYPSNMPLNFPAHKLTGFETEFPGRSIDQVVAARDLIMVYSRIEDSAYNRYWTLLQPELAAAALKKPPEKNKNGK